MCVCLSVCLSVSQTFKPYIMSIKTLLLRSEGVSIWTTFKIINITLVCSRSEGSTSLPMNKGIKVEHDLVQAAY